jgi:hypothetical protein
MTAMAEQLDPFRNLNIDVPRAIGELFDGDVGLEDFEMERRPAAEVQMVIEQVWRQYEPFIDPGALAGLPADEIQDRVAALTDAEFAKRAVSWIHEGLPAVILAVCDPDALLHEYHIGDGQRRLALAAGLGLETIAVVILKRKTARR